MNKFTIPAILVVTVLVAGIFAFMPVEKASTVHTTIQSTIQNTQLNNIKTTYDTNLQTNATASCGSAGGGFLVYWTFSNDTRAAVGSSDGSTLTGLGIQNTTGTGVDIAIALYLGNQSSISGVVGGLSGETITFTGNSSQNTGGLQSFEDTGDLVLTVVCRSGSTAATTP